MFYCSPISNPSPFPCQMGPVAMPSTWNARKQRGNIYKWCTAHVPVPFCIPHPTLARAWAALSPQGAGIPIRGRFGLELCTLPQEDVKSSTPLQCLLLPGRWQGWNSSMGEMPWPCWTRNEIWWLVCWIHHISLSCKLQPRSSRANLEVHLNICVCFSPSNGAKLTLSQFWHKEKELNLEKQLAGGCSVAAQAAEEGVDGPRQPLWDCSLLLLWYYLIWH